MTLRFPEIFPVLQTEHLLLREITDADAEDLFLMRDDERVRKYFDIEPLKKVEEERERIKTISANFTNQGGILWAICLHCDNRIKGTVGIWKITKEHFRGEIGYLLHPELWGKGLMAEAILASIEYAFHTMNLHSIEAKVNVLNARSIRVLERTGFVKEAHFREDYFFRGKFLDTGVYSILNNSHK